MCRTLGETPPIRRKDGLAWGMPEWRMGALIEPDSTFNGCSIFRNRFSKFWESELLSRIETRSPDLGLRVAVPARLGSHLAKKSFGTRQKLPPASVGIVDNRC